MNGKSSHCLLYVILLHYKVLGGLSLVQFNCVLVKQNW